MSYLADIVAGGIDPLQDTDRDASLSVRTVRMGCRVIDREPNGDLIVDRDSVGDQMGWVLWHQIRGARPMPMWAQAIPARVVNAQSSGGTGTAADFFAVLPIGDLFNYDARFGVKIPAMGRIAPGSNRRIWQRSPRGTVGVVVATTDERNPGEVFLPTDPRMVAVNIRGSGDMGSQVYDLAEGNDYDPTRCARLQMAWRVVPLGTSNGIPGFVPDPDARDGAMLSGLAWNLNLTGQERALGRGMVIDQLSAATPPPPEPPGVETPSNSTPRPAPPPPAPPAPPPPAPPPPGGGK